MTVEQSKDIRQMIELVSKDFARLSDDLMYLAEYIGVAEKSESSRDSYCNCLRNIKMNERR